MAKHIHVWFHTNDSEGPAHAPAGSPKGGQFVSGAGGGSGLTKKGGFDPKKKIGNLFDYTHGAVSEEQRQSPDSVENPLYDHQAAKAVQKLTFSSHDFKKLETQNIDVASLVSGQPDVNPRKVQRLASDFDPADNEVYVVQFQGKNYLWDGNHRANAASLAGVSKIPAKILKVN